jgi:hypothetical protein
METVIYGVLKEEKQRNKRLQDVYEKELSSLPKGSIVVKRISGNDYYYLKYRQKNKVKTDYIGKDEKMLVNLKRDIERRNELINVLKRLKIEHRQICKIVKE